MNHAAYKAEYQSLTIEATAGVRNIFIKSAFFARGHVVHLCPFPFYSITSIFIQCYRRCRPPREGQEQRKVTMCYWLVLWKSCRQKNNALLSDLFMSDQRWSSCFKLSDGKHNNNIYVQGALLCGRLTPPATLAQEGNNRNTMWSGQRSMIDFRWKLTTWKCQEPRRHGPGK